MSDLPRTFCITLKETPERYNAAKTLFASIGLNVEFFEGVHGETFGVKTSIPNLEEIRGREYFITPGHIGCILSHFSLWKMLQFQPEDEFLIFEDDALPIDSFKEYFQEFYKELPSDWQFVYVGWIPIPDEPPTPISAHIANYKPYGTHAYLIKKSALPVLIETNKVLWYHIDMQIRNRSLPSLRHYTFNPSLASQKSVYNIADPIWFSQCYDWNLDPHALKKETTSEVLFFGRGWHPLEKNSEGYFIWTDGRSELLIEGKWSTMELDVIAEGGSEGQCKILKPGKCPSEITLKCGVNHLTIDLDEDDKSVIFDTNTFSPAHVYKSADSRTLGIRILKGITLKAPDQTKHYVSLSNIERHVAVVGKVRIDEYENFRYTPSKSRIGGKFNLRNQLSFAHHRSGWSYALKVLSDEHNNDGVKFDGFLDHTFGLGRVQNTQIRNIPYREPWVGVFHNPPMTPSIFADNATPASMVLSGGFQESLATCKGLYVLSEHHARFIRSLIPNLSVEVFFLPTEFPEVKFSMDAFMVNSDKKVVNIGWWLRKMSSIYHLEVNPSIFRKFRILPTSLNQSNLAIERVFNIEKDCLFPLTQLQQQSVTTIRHMSNQDYDDLLSKNVVFVDLYDASANNVVVECIVRATPILINPLPAVVEYLGAGYPLYFKDVKEASEKLHNGDLIYSAHKYLLGWEGVHKLTAESFMKTIRTGKIFQSL